MNWVIKNILFMQLLGRWDTDHGWEV